MSEPVNIDTSTAIRRALVEAPGLKKGLLGTIAFAMTGTAIKLTIPVAVQQLLDRELLATSVDMTSVLRRVSLLSAVILIGIIAQRATLIRLATAAAVGLSELRVKTFGHLHDLSVLHVEAERRGTLVSRVTTDITSVQHFVEWGGIEFVIETSQVVLATVVMAFYDWHLSLLVVISMLTYGVLLLRFQRILQRAHDAVRERVALSMSRLGEAISGITVVRAYGAETAAVQRVDEAFAHQYEAEVRTSRVGATLFSSAEIFTGLITVAIISAGVSYGVGWDLSAGDLLAFLFLLGLIVGPIQLMVEVLDHAQTAGAGLRRVLRVLDTEPEITEPVDPASLPDTGLSIEFSSVRFRYPTGDDVLPDVSILIEPGRRVAVVGETGSGKTTFAKLAVRLLEPAEGTVAIGGVDVRRIRREELRARVAFVPQEGFLFDTTVGENLRYGKLDATDDDLRSALADLELSEWLDGLPNGLATQVGERGGTLSAGERQLVALVRAWLSNPDMLVLDEATSAVDPALEVRLRRAIERLTTGRTSITVAHRLSTAEGADEVLVFDRGRLVERGTHAKLVELGGVYAAMHADWAVGTSN